MIYVGDNKIKNIYIGDTKIKKVYIGDTKVYSAGNTVTYHVDASTTYIEEVDAGETVLSPKTFTPTKSGWTFVGWRQDKSANGTVLNSLSMGDDPIELYAVFRQTVSLSYNGNGYTGGTAVAAQTGNMYYNNGNVLGATFTVKANTFTKTAYSFAKWRLNSTNGSAYSPNSSITLSANAIMYAEWTYVGNPFYIVQDYVCKYAVTWSTQRHPNESAYATQWNVGNQYVTVVANGYHVNNKAEGYRRSQNIPTNGNHTFYVKTLWAGGNSSIVFTLYNAANNAVLKTVESYHGLGNDEFTVDISGCTSIYMQVSINSTDEDDHAWIQPVQMRLY